MHARAAVHHKGHHREGALARVRRINCQGKVYGGGGTWAGRGMTARVQHAEVEKHRNFLADAARTERSKTSCRCCWCWSSQTASAESHPIFPLRSGYPKSAARIPPTRERLERKRRVQRAASFCASRVQCDAAPPGRARRSAGGSLRNRTVSVFFGGG